MLRNGQCPLGFLAHIYSTENEILMLGKLIIVTAEKILLGSSVKSGSLVLGSSAHTGSFCLFKKFLYHFYPNHKKYTLQQEVGKYWLENSLHFIIIRLENNLT